MKITYQTQFKKDVKKIERRGWSIGLLEEAMDCLIQGGTLPPRYRDHALEGEYADVRDLHVGPDWLLLYIRLEDEFILVRTGTHADLSG
jgi:mRNA interferase YafQ